jgi:hypothetical protein
MESTTACSCVGSLPLSTHFGYADIIFNGRAIKVTVDEPNFQRKVIFYVHVIFKGKYSARKITITTGMDGASCGLGIRKGEKWQIWATGSGDHFEAHSCSPSTESINANIDFLRNQTRSTSTSR